MTNRFLASIDNHLATLDPGSARAKFLAGWLKQTEEKYREFVKWQGKGFPADVTATDFVIRLGELQKRFDRVKTDELRLAS